MAEVEDHPLLAADLNHPVPRVDQVVALREIEAAPVAVQPKTQDEHGIDHPIQPSLAHHKMAVWAVAEGLDKVRAALAHQEIEAMVAQAIQVLQEIPEVPETEAAAKAQVHLGTLDEILDLVETKD